MRCFRPLSPCEAWELPPAAGADGVPPALLVLSRGNVVVFRGDVVVNSANTGCLGGGGVDGAITRAGGTAMAAERRALPVLDARQTRCPIGDAKRTSEKGLSGLSQNKHFREHSGRKQANNKTVFLVEHNFWEVLVLTPPK